MLTFVLLADARIRKKSPFGRLASGKVELAPQVFIRTNGVVRVCGRGKELELAVGARPHRGNFAHGSHDDEAALGHGGNTLAQAPLGAYGPVGLLSAAQRDGRMRRMATQRKHYSRVALVVVLFVSLSAFARDRE